MLGLGPGWSISQPVVNAITIVSSFEQEIVHFIGSSISYRSAIVVSLWLSLRHLFFISCGPMEIIVEVLESIWAMMVEMSEACGFPGCYARRRPLA